MDEDSAREEFCKRKFQQLNNQINVDSKRLKVAEKRQAELKAKAESASQATADVDEFIRRVKQYASLTELDRTTAMDLIEYITVGRVPKDKSTPREIHIYYKFLDQRERKLYMKKRLKTLALIFISLCAMVFIACSSSDGGSYIGVAKKYNDNITYKLSYASEEECPGGNITNNKLHASMDFKTGKTYYMVVDFTVSSFNVSGWDNSFSSSIKISPVTAISAKLEEATTSNFTEKAENDGTRITTTYSIPEKRGNERSYRIVVQLVFKSDGLGYVDLSFYGNGENANSAEVAEEFVGCNATVGLNYKLNEDKLYYSVVEPEYTLGSEYNYNNVMIPSIYRGLPVKVIGNFAFSWCGLTSITIPDSVTGIGYKAFKDCHNLKSVNIPASVTSIDGTAFENCIRLESLTVQGGNAIYHSDGNCIIETQRQALIVGCKNSIIPDDGSVTSIDNFAFYGCSGLTSINIPDSVTGIGYSTFCGCSGLTRLTIPASLTSIGQYAFRDADSDCENLTSIIFEDASEWYVEEYRNPEWVVNIDADDLSDSATAANLLRNIYAHGEWKRR